MAVPDDNGPQRKKPRQHMDIAIASVLAATEPNSAKQALDRAVQCTECTWTQYGSPADSFMTGCAFCMHQWGHLARASRQAIAEETQQAADELHKRQEHTKNQSSIAQQTSNEARTRKYQSSF